MIPGSEAFATRPVDAETLIRSLPSRLQVHSVTQETVSSTHLTLPTILLV